ncbi:RNA polymerase subunit sigma-70 [Pseudonocardia broussonetiae]|uniref:RNA polymerase subunit sigma-70 n=1 Tax=Pseudonocardia broussonetiae TaxID=2736640 RepID=A0A6M6JK91_9PSEU|nr:RNA polymerase subunit sigma-70 [Pseudonocardia broussonetiae]QJY48574.1 RNA polymerase subunit sigma-70 [Pseudonocardia broussonetiae]
MDDEGQYTALVERHRRELQVHCYRMLGSFDESQDAVQETFLRAWRSRATARDEEDGGHRRAWLYRIATTTCLDMIGKRRAGGAGGTAEVAWLQPYPDALLDLPDPGDGPDAVTVARETIELAFLAAVQHLPPRQRAVLLLRDVLGWRAAETAHLLDVSVAAANSALQRARATMREQLPERRAEWPAPSDDERALLKRWIDASERSDLDTLVALLAEHARQTMPPLPVVNEGRDTISETWSDVLTGPEAWGEWRCVPVEVNRQIALACYLRPTRERELVDGVRVVPGPHFDACALDVLRVEDGLVTEVTTFGREVFASLGLPARL